MFYVIQYYSQRITIARKITSRLNDLEKNGRETGELKLTRRDQCTSYSQLDAIHASPVDFNGVGPIP